MIRIMIADDNKELNSKCSDFLAKDNNIIVVAQTANGKDTIEKYRELMPDILLLDLKLPKKDGIEVINELCLDTEEKKKCNIIVITGSISKRIQLRNTAKVYSVLSKPVNFDEVHQLITEYNFQTLSEQKIRDFFDTIGITDSSSPSYNYLIDAIRISYSSPSLLDNLQEIYNIVGSKYGFSGGKVKWKIRNNVTKIEKQIPDELMDSIFGIQSSRDNLTPRIFLNKVIKYEKVKQSTSF